MRGFRHLAIIAVLTILSQLGGVAWLLALAFKQRLPAFAGCYAVIWIGAFALAPAFGRVPLPCFGDPLRAQSPIY